MPSVEVSNLWNLAQAIVNLAQERKDKDASLPLPELTIVNRGTEGYTLIVSEPVSMEQTIKMRRGKLGGS